MLDFTHDPEARSWIAGANADDTDFPLQNLPFGRFRRANPAGAHSGPEPWRIGVAIGDKVLDLAALGALDPQVAALLGPLGHGDLNGFMAQGRAACIALRQALFEGLSARPSGTASLWQARRETLLVPRADQSLSRVAPNSEASACAMSSGAPRAFGGPTKKPSSSS